MPRLGEAMAEKISNPRRTEWEKDFAKCSTCTADPNDKWGREQIAAHGHGYPPGHYLWKTSDGRLHRSAKKAKIHEDLNGLNKARSPLSRAQSWAFANPDLAKYDNDGNPVEGDMDENWNPKRD
jgi:hypothetical protein